MPISIVLQDAYKQFTLDQDKTASPAETVRCVKKTLEGLDLRILKETRRIDNGRLDIPVYFSVCGQDAFTLTGTRKQMGKGATPDQAEASALMELVERFSFYAHYKAADRHATARHVDLGPAALSLDMLADSVNDNSPDREVALSLFSQMPVRWARGYNLTATEPLLIPIDWFFSINQFNGSSAGNCMEETLVQGICELVERDVSDRVSHGRMAVPRIDPKSATQPLVLEMLEKYAAAGIDIHLSDFTLEMGIPTVGVLAYDPATHPAESEIVWTAGTAPDPQKALSRALSETAQLGGDFNTGANYVASGLPKFGSMEEARFITEAAEKVSIFDLPNISDVNLKTEVERLVAALKKRNMEVLVIDTTHPDLGVPAAYIMIPGARFRERSRSGGVGLFTAKLATETRTPRQALKDLDFMQQVMGRRYYLNFYKGLCNLNMEAPEQALAELETALSLDPAAQDVPSIYSYMGQCLKEMERYKDAITALKKGEEVDAERTDILNLMGFCHFKRKDHDKAIECFERLIRLDPASAIDYANIASNYREMGDTGKAIHYYETAVSIDPTIDFAWDNLLRLKGSAE